MRDAESEYALCSGFARNPLVSICARLRHARFNLHKLSASSRTAPAHLAVTYRLRNRRVPSAEKIGAERNDIVRSAEFEGRQRRMTKAQQICLPQHSFVERFVPDCRRRAIGFQKTLDQFVALATQRH